MRNVRYWTGEGGGEVSGQRGLGSITDIALREDDSMNGKVKKKLETSAEKKTEVFESLTSIITSPLTGSNYPPGTELSHIHSLIHDLFSIRQNEQQKNKGREIGNSCGIEVRSVALMESLTAVPFRK